MTSKSCNEDAINRVKCKRQYLRTSYSHQKCAVIEQAQYYTLLATQWEQWKHGPNANDQINDGQLEPRDERTEGIGMNNAELD